MGRYMEMAQILERAKEQTYGAIRRDLGFDPHLPHPIEAFRSYIDEGVWESTPSADSVEDLCSLLLETPEIADFAISLRANYIGEALSDIVDKYVEQQITEWVKETYPIEED